MLEELKELRKRNEELIYNSKECQMNKAKTNQLEGELNKLRDQFSVVNAQNIKLKQDSEGKNQANQGQLPNLDLGKVSVIPPSLNGAGKYGKKNSQKINQNFKILLSYLLPLKPNFFDALTWQKK